MQPIGRARTTKAPVEIEWQFDALDLPSVERFLVRETENVNSVLADFRAEAVEPAKRLVDTYFDSDDWRIGRAGYVLRERRVARRVEVTMKSLAQATDGLRQRIEITEDGQLSEITLSGRGPVSERIRALLGSAALLEVVRVTTRRKPFQISAGGVVLGELVLDETSITVPGIPRRLPLRRVEFEVTPQGAETAPPFVEQMRLACALSPVTLSKFEAGLLAAGTSIPGAPDLGPIHVGPQATIGELALSALRRSTVELLEREPGTRLGEDIEELHQMRVATRRLRAAMSLFSDVLPLRAVALREEIGWLASVLGAVRDLDVQLERTESWILDADEFEAKGLEELAQRLEGEREIARAELLGALDSRRYDRLVSGMTTMLRTATGRRSPDARRLAVSTMPALIASRHIKVVRDARRARKSGVPEDFHALRIRVKRLRYSLDFATDLYGSSARRYAKVLASVQGRLGQMQDAEVASARLRSLALEPGEGLALSSEAIFVVGGLSARYRAESLRLLSRLPGELEGLRGQEWQRLSTQLERTAASAALLARPVTRLGVAAPIVLRVELPRAVLEEVRPTSAAVVPFVEPQAQTPFHAPPGAGASPSGAS